MADLGKPQGKIVVWRFVNAVARDDFDTRFGVRVGEASTLKEYMEMTSPFGFYYACSDMNAEYLPTIVDINEALGVS